MIRSGVTSGVLVLRMIRKKWKLCLVAVKMPFISIRATNAGRCLAFEAKSYYFIGIEVNLIVIGKETANRRPQVMRNRYNKSGSENMNVSTIYDISRKLSLFFAHTFGGE